MPHNVITCRVPKIRIGYNLVAVICGVDHEHDSLAGISSREVIGVDESIS